MVCVNNVVFVCAATGTVGSEGRLIRSNIIPCAIYCLVMVMVFGIAVMAGTNPVPPNGGG